MPTLSASVTGRIGAGAVWLATRALLIAMIAKVVPYPRVDEVMGDVKFFYLPWSDVLATGNFPTGDAWQYPPMAAPLLLLPRLTGLDYVQAWVGLSLLVDLLVFVILARRQKLSGAWLWVAAMPALGPVCYYRYDLMVTVVAVLALIVVVRHRLFGVLVSIGALLKVWPVLLLPVAGRGGWLRAGVAFVLTTAAVLVASLGIGGNSLGFLKGQEGRGLEMESLAATPFMIRYSRGAGPEIRYQFGSLEVVGDGVQAVAGACLFATVVLMGLALAIALRSGRMTRWTPAAACDMALVFILVSVATSRVLSPQYMIWLLGIAAVCLSHRETRQRPTALLILAATVLTQLIYPVFWDGLLLGHPAEVGLLVVRNFLVLIALLVSLGRLWPAHRPALAAQGSMVRGLPARFPAIRY